MISVAQLQQFLEYAPDKVEQQILPLRDEVVSLFEKLTNGLWTLRTDYVQEEQTDCDVRGIWLRLLPVTAITTVESKALGDSAYEVEDPASYELVRGRRLVRASGYWPALVRITYDGGYDETTCPSDIRRALMLQVQFTEARNKGGRGIMTQESLQGGSTSYADADLHATFRMVARAHRRMA